MSIKKKTKVSKKVLSPGKRQKANEKITVDKDERQTPQLLYDNLQAALNLEFSLDAAATGRNKKAKAYITKKQNALITPWSVKGKDRYVFCNPPYSKTGGGVGAWLAKGVEEVKAGRVNLVAFLITLDSGVKWYADFSVYAKEIWQVFPRVKFAHPDVHEKASADFSSSIFIFQKGHLDGSPTVRLWDWQDGLFLW